MSSNKAPVNLSDARKQRADQAYRDLVMMTFKDMEHADKLAQLEQKAAVERAARDRL